MKKLLILIPLTGLLFTACKEPVEGDFDRGAMLESIASSHISPEYASMEAELNAFVVSAQVFEESPSFENLSKLRDQYLLAYLNFQRIKMFDFGPAGDYALKASMNTYPTDPTKIDANITSGSYVLGAVANVDAIGFPAIDYLLFEGGDTEVINRFTVDINAANAINYLKDLINKMRDEFALVHNEWKTGYTTTFIAANGTDVGSSISLMFNEFVKDIELVKNAKIGIPAGQFSGGETFPDFVEAFYSGYSQQLAIENTVALKRVFTGGDGQGFDDYMDFVEANQGITVTSSEITAQFDVCKTKIEELGNPFSDDIPVNFSGFSTTFQEFKKLTAFAKTDISGALGVLITFSDTDGD